MTDSRSRKRAKQAKVFVGGSCWMCGATMVRHGCKFMAAASFTECEKCGEVEGPAFSDDGSELHWLWIHKCGKMCR